MEFRWKACSKNNSSLERVDSRVKHRWSLRLMGSWPLIGSTPSGDDHGCDFIFQMSALYLPSLPIVSCSLFCSAAGISTHSKALARVFQPGPKLLKLRSRDKSLRTRNHPSCTFQCAQRPTHIIMLKPSPSSFLFFL